MLEMSRGRAGHEQALRLRAMGTLQAWRWWRGIVFVVAGRQRRRRLAQHGGAATILAIGGLALLQRQASGATQNLGLSCTGFKE